MAWDTVETKQERQFAAKGLATVRTGETKAIITFIKTDKKGNPIVWDTGETSKKFHREDLPDNFLFEPHTEAEYFVCTSFDKSEVFAIGPWKGTFEMRLHDISRNKDTKEPIYFENSGKDLKTGKPYHSLKFKLFWKIVSGEFKGCIVSEMFVLQDEKNGVQEQLIDGVGTGFVAWRGGSEFSDKAIWQPRLKDAFSRLGVDKELTPWNNGDILGEVWNRMEEHTDETFMMDVDEGEVKGFSKSQGKRKVEVSVDVDDDETPGFMKDPEPVVEPVRTVKEIKEELGFEDARNENQDNHNLGSDTVPAPKDKRAAKKIVDPDDEL